MKIYVLTKVEDYEQEDFVTLNRCSIFEKIIADCDRFNEIGWYLTIWEDEKIIGDHDIMYMLYDNSKLENPLPTDVVLNNIIDNKIADKFTVRL